MINLTPDIFRRKTPLSILLPALVVLLWAVGCAAALAQSVAQIDVRTGRHDGYSRVVFEWPASTGYAVEKQSDETVVIRFKKSGEFDLATVKSDLPSNLLALREGDKQTEQLTVEIDIPEQSRTRDFSIGNRIILDVYDPPGGPVESPDKPEASPESVDQKQENRQQQEVETARTSQAETPPQNDAYRVENARPVDTPDVDVDPLDDAKPLKERARIDEDLPPPPSRYRIEENHTITITSTRAIFVSAFERQGDLWIIHNQPDNNVPPKLVGPEKDKFPEFEDVTIGDGFKAFRLGLPANAEVYTEGGGLLWRINVVTRRPDIEYTAPRSLFDDNGEASQFWDMPSAHFKVQFEDPDVGDQLIAVGVGKAGDFAGPDRQFVEHSVLPSYAGLVLKPKVDDLSVTLQDRGVLVSRDGGLALSKGQNLRKVFEQDEAPPQRSEDQSAYNDAAQSEGDDEERIRRIYNFTRWILGGPTSLRENENLLLENLKQADKVGKTENLLSLAKLFIANSRGAEAIGYLNYASDVTPDLAESPEFLALKGAAEAIAGQYQDAFDDYARADLDKYREIDLWRSIVLAGLGDWDQAGSVMPEDTTIVNSYPFPLRPEVALTLAEIALRDGRQDQADDLLAIPKAVSDQLNRFQKAALDYLSGEAHRQRGEKERAVALWEPLAESLDDLHRAKAGLALTKLLYEMGKIDEEEAINRLEQLRYGWRGDTLETRVYQALGDFYLKNRNYLKGLAVLRRGTELSSTPNLSRQITKQMSDAFETLFLTDEINKLSPLEAVSVYEEFQELTPAGEKGDRVIRKLAERLIEVGLLGRAASLIDYLVETRLSGIEASKAALRLASVQILDDKPDAALISLEKAEEFLAASRDPDYALDRDIALLKARAYSDKGMAQRAISTLSRIPRQEENVLKLRADIAWQNGKWNEAARALERLVARERISIQQPLSERQASLILNWAVALNLAGDRRALASLRNRFSTAVEETTRARLFDVVTRARQNTRLTDRETIRAIVSEVDLFEDFLTSYKQDIQQDKPSSN